MTAAGHRASSDSAILDGLGRALATLAGLGVLLAFAPGVIAGVLIAFGLRLARCRWTWAVLVAVPLAVPVAVGPTRRARDVETVAAAAIDDRAVDAAQVCGALWPIWALIAGLTAVIVKRWIERRTRLHGGRGERELKRELGIVAVGRRSLERQRAHRAPLGDARGVLLGFSRIGEPLRIPPLRTHAMIVGGSGSGKTTSAQVLLEGEVEAGRGFLILDGKGGRGLPEFAIELGARYHRPVAVWSVLPYGAPALDELRRAWNPAGGGNPTEIKDRIAAAEDQTEPYYAAIAARGLLCAARAAQQEYGRAPGLDELASLLDSPAQLVSLLRSVDPTGHARDIAWLGGLTDGDGAACAGWAHDW